MKVLIIGGSSASHALAWLLRKQNPKMEILAIPGNVGMRHLAKCYSGIRIDTPEGINTLVGFTKEKRIDLVIVASFSPLLLGIAEVFKSNHISIFAPLKNTAELELNKKLTKYIIRANDIPALPFWIFNLTDEELLGHLAMAEFPLILKRSVFRPKKQNIKICFTYEEAKSFISICQNSGDQEIILENCSSCPDVISLSFFIDENNLLPLPPVLKHELISNGECSAVTRISSPVLDFRPHMYEQFIKTILIPIIEGQQRKKVFCKGILNFDCIVKNGKPLLLEFNNHFTEVTTPIQLMRIKECSLLEIILKTLDGNLDETNCDADKAAAGIALPPPCDAHYISGLDKINSSHPDTIVFHDKTEEINNRIICTGGKIIVAACAETVLAATLNCYEAIDKGGISFH